MLSERDINVVDMLNKSKGDIAYTLMDIADEPNEALLAALSDIDGVINVRAL